MKALILTPILFLILSGNAFGASTQCSVNPNPIDSSQFVIDIDGKPVAQTHTFHDAMGIVNRLASNKSCTVVNTASLERSVNQPCAASLCGDGAESCMGPCQCNGMQCVVY